ncbi:tetratricopeptide repeat protein [Hirschia litorea]|uniref:Tetratricopeptide repeat protein n=1 Tax=Hirschia litorea TaxID=1199156 RepID=A0ABW2ILK6_9PROT
MIAVLRPTKMAIMSLIAAYMLPHSAFAQAQAPQTDTEESTTAIPQPCLEAFDAPEKWVECARQADPGSQASMLAYSNIGAQAYFNGDFQSAARFFDLSTPADGGPNSLDAYAHALRASTYWRVGENKKAANHVKFSYRWIKENQLGAGKNITLDEELLEPLLEVLVPVSAHLDLPEADDILHRYQTLPIGSLMDAARRAGVLASIEQFEAALIYSATVVSGQPENPLFLSSHCLLLTRMGRPEKGISFCESALELDPKNPDIFFNKAMTLAALGKCQEAWDAQTKAQQLAPRHPVFEDILECSAAK